MDIRTLLEELRDLLDCVYCSKISSGRGGGLLSHLMIAMFNLVSNKSIQQVVQDDDSLPRVNYYNFRE